ncbi:TPA: hypothetical protein ACPD20_004446, partial [Yersinia enterocolitica]
TSVQVAKFSKPLQWLILNSNVRFSLLTAFGCIMLATLCHILNQVRLTMHMLAHLKCKYLSG